MGDKRGNYRHRGDYIRALMGVLKFDRWQSAEELMALLSVDARHVLLNRYIRPAYEEGLVEYFLKNLETAKSQRYKKTQKAAIDFGV